jgi:hypothetical protein
MSLSTQLTSEQLKKIIKKKKNTNKSAMVVQEPVEDGEEVLNPGDTTSVLNTVLNTIYNKFEHECLDHAVRLLNAHHVHQSPDDRIPGRKYSIPGLPGTIFVVHKVCTIWFIVRRLDWDADMLGTLVAEEMGLGKTFTSVAAAKLSKLVT